MEYKVKTLLAIYVENYIINDVEFKRDLYDTYIISLERIKNV